MGLDFVELILQMVGRGVGWVLRIITGRQFHLSDSAYEVLGFVLAVLLVTVLLLMHTYGSRGEWFAV